MDTGKKIIQGIKLCLLLLCIMGAKQSMAQLRGINYQAVAIDESRKEFPGRDNAAQPLVEKTIGVRFTVLSGGPNGVPLYQETHETTTDKFGLFSLIIGDGKVTTAGTYSALAKIPWSAANQFLKVELDLNNTGDFKLMSNQQFMAVPYAFYALNTDTTRAGPAGPAGPTGPTGVPGKSTMVKTTPEPAGTNCANGGIKTEYGLDADNNGTLDSTEIVQALTQIICNGIPGTNGTNGNNGFSSLAL